MKIVLDTNVLISGLLNPNGPPGRVIDFLRSGVLQVIIDDRILAEYIDVLRRDYFLRYFEKTEREDVIEYLKKNSCYISSRIIVSDLPDPGDIPFLEIALSEDTPLITGNLKHFPKSARRNCIILTPRQFIDRYFAGRY